MHLARSPTEAKNSSSVIAWRRAALSPCRLAPCSTQGKAPHCLEPGMLQCTASPNLGVHQGLTCSMAGTGRLACQLLCVWPSDALQHAHHAKHLTCTPMRFLMDGCDLGGSGMEPRDHQDGTRQRQLLCSHPTWVGTAAPLQHVGARRVQDGARAGRRRYAGQFSFTRSVSVCYRRASAVTWLPHQQSCPRLSQPG